MLNQYYMLVRQGKPQRLTVTQGHHDFLAWPVTRTHKDAMQLVKWLGSDELRPALIGSVQGESFDDHLVRAAMEGCEALCMITRWNKGNAPVWCLVPLHVGDYGDTNPVAYNEEAWFHVSR